MIRFLAHRYFNVVDLFAMALALRVFFADHQWTAYGLLLGISIVSFLIEEIDRRRRAA